MRAAEVQLDPFRRTWLSGRRSTEDWVVTMPLGGTMDHIGLLRLHLGEWTFITLPYSPRPPYFLDPRETRI